MDHSEPMCKQCPWLGQWFGDAGRLRAATREFKRAECPNPAAATDTQNNATGRVLGRCAVLVPGAPQAHASILTAGILRIAAGPQAACQPEHLERRNGVTTGAASRNTQVPVRANVILRRRVNGSVSCCFRAGRAGCLASNAIVNADSMVEYL